MSPVSWRNLLISPSHKWAGNSTHTCVCVCVCVCVCMCACVGTNVYIHVSGKASMWYMLVCGDQRSTSGVILMISVYLLWDMASYWLRVTKKARLAGQRGSTSKCWHYKQAPPHPGFYVGTGITFGSSCFPSKHFTDQAISLAQVTSYFLLGRQMQGSEVNCPSLASWQERPWESNPWSLSGAHISPVSSPLANLGFLLRHGLNDFFPLLWQTIWESDDLRKERFVGLTVLENPSWRACREEHVTGMSHRPEDREDVGLPDLTWFAPFPLFYSVQAPSPQDGAGHMYGGSSVFSQSFLGTSL
jgi:hypothetical protein